MVDLGKRAAAQVLLDDLRGTRRTVVSRVELAHTFAQLHRPRVLRSFADVQSAPQRDDRPDRSGDQSGCAGGDEDCSAGKSRLRHAGIFCRCEITSTRACIQTARRPEDVLSTVSPLAESAADETWNGEPATPHQARTHSRGHDSDSAKAGPLFIARH